MSEDSISPFRIGYVVSMSQGLQSFVYREIKELFALGLVVHLFPIKVGSGPYAADPKWPVHKLSLLDLFLTHLETLIADSRRYLSVLYEAIGLGGLIDFVIAVHVAKKARQNKLRLVHCHFGDHKLFVGYFYGKLSGNPVSVTIHAYELYNNPNPRLFLKALNFVRAIVAVAEYNRSTLCAKYGIDPAKIHVVPLFTDPPPAVPSNRDGSDRIVVLTVARFVEKKGHRTLLNALKLLPEEYEAWFVGSGPLDLPGLAKSCGVKSRVRILGRLSDSDLQASYRAATVFCLPSETSSSGDREGVPVSLMEAMSYGLPVVATRHAGIPELVPEILVDEGDFEALAREIHRLGQDPDLREELGRRNRELVLSRFSSKNVDRLRVLFGEWAR